MHPDGLPDLFLDRSLGRYKVAALLRSERLRLVTLAEHYGVPADQSVEDTEWLQLCGTMGWVALMKDRAVSRNSFERETIKKFGVRCFVISNANMDAEAVAQRYIRRLKSMTQACRDRRGPFIYTVNDRRIGEIKLH